MRSVIVGLAMLTASPCLAQQQITEAQVRRDCRADALHYCPREALRCLAHEDDECRAAVIACMLGHRDQLKPRCSRHLY